MDFSHREPPPYAITAHGPLLSGVLHVVQLGLGSPSPGGATWSTAGYGVRISVASHVVLGAIEVAHVQRGDQNLATLLLTPVVPLGVTASQLLFSQGCLCPTRDFCCRRVAPSVLMLASPGICVGSAIPTACPASRQPARVLPHCSLGV